MPHAATERDMLDRLLVRYGTTFNAGHYSDRRYLRAEQVPLDPARRAGTRVADFIAIDTFSTGHEKLTRAERGDPASHPGQSVHFHEVKVTRPDLLVELGSPEKSEPWRRHSHYWWLVVADTVAVMDGELPEGWGLLVPHGRALRCVVPAPRHDAAPLTTASLAALVRSVYQTELRDKQVSRSVSDLRGAVQRGCGEGLSLPAQPGIVPSP